MENTCLMQSSSVARKSRKFIFISLYFPIHQGTDSFATIITTNIIAM